MGGAVLACGCAAYRHCLLDRALCIDDAQPALWPDGGAGLGVCGGGHGLAYSVGYAISAFGRRAWLGGISRVNVIVALVLIVVIAATLTPLLSPYRLAANSQFQLVREKGLAVEHEKRIDRYPIARNTPLHYLRFDSGRYGQVRLQELAELQTGRDTDEVGLIAKGLLAQKTNWQPPPAMNIRADLAKLRIYPGGRALDKDMIEALSRELEKPNSGFAFQEIGAKAVGLFINLNADQADEFVLLTKDHGVVFERQAGQWLPAGNVYRRDVPSKRDLDLAAELAEGKILVIPPKWNELSIDGFTFTVSPLPRP